MLEPKPPCKNCPDRFLGCHDSCPSYQKYKQDHLLWSSVVSKNRMDDTQAEISRIMRFEKYNEAKKKGYVK